MSPHFNERLAADITLWHDKPPPSCLVTGQIKCLCRVLCSGCWVEPLFMAAMGCSLGLCNLSARLSSPGAAPRGLCCTLPRARPPPRRGSVETRGRSVAQRHRHRGDQCVARGISASKPTLYSQDKGDFWFYCDRIGGVCKCVRMQAEWFSFSQVMNNCDTRWQFSYKVDYI